MAECFNAGIVGRVDLILQNANHNFFKNAKCNYMTFGPPLFDEAKRIICWDSAICSEVSNDGTWVAR